MEKGLLLRDCSGIPIDSMNILLEHYGEDALLAEIMEGPHSGLVRMAIEVVDSHQNVDALIQRLRNPCRASTSPSSPDAE